MKIQWYPGHMAKAKRNIQSDLNLVDLVIEIVDARCPLSSRNPDIDRFAKNKARILLLNKADLADRAVTRQFSEYFASKGFHTLEIDARNKASLKKLNALIEHACKAKLERDQARGIVNKNIRAMVLGIPNVGKSTFINSYVGRAMAKTGNKPGVTKGNQWIKIGGRLELLDTPGITWPRFEDELVGMNLALIGSINDEILNTDELALYLIGYLQKNYPAQLDQRYEETLSNLEPLSAYETIARKRNCLKKGAEIDYTKTAKLILEDLRSGRLGMITLERP